MDRKFLGSQPIDCVAVMKIGMRALFLIGVVALFVGVRAPETIAWTHGTSAPFGKTVLNGYSRFTSMAFANLMKNATEDSLNGTAPSEYDDGGYPITTPSNSLGRGFILHLPDAGTVPNPYVLKWKPSPGKTRQGSFAVNIALTVLSVGGTVNAITYGSGGQTTGSKASITLNAEITPRVVFTLNAAPDPAVGIGVSFPGYAGVSLYNQMGDLIICRLSDEDRVDADQNALTPEFISANLETYANIIRDMNWTIGGGDQTMVSQTQYRWPTSAITYFGDRYPTGSWSGATSGGTAAYTATAPPDGFSLTDGATLQVKFNVTNSTTTPTLDVASTGVKTITNWRGFPLSVSGLSTTTPTTLIYSAALDQFISQTGGMHYGPPREVRVAIANRFNKHLWTNFPVNYTVASAQSDAAYISGALGGQQWGLFEEANEMWNFSQSNLADVSGIALGFPGFPGSYRANLSWTALRFKQLMDGVTIGWGARSASQLKRVMAVWAFHPAGTAAVNTYQLQGSDLASVANGGAGNARYVTVTGNANYRIASSRPVDVMDVFSYAHYYQGAQIVQFPDIDYGTGNFTTANLAGAKGAADDYASGVPAQQAAALAWLDNDIRQGTLGGVTGEQTLRGLCTTAAGGVGIYNRWQLMLTANGYAQKVIAYEGGLGLGYPTTAVSTTVWGTTIYGGSSGRIANLIEAYKASSYAQQIVIDQSKQFLGTGPESTGCSTLPNSLYPSWFILDDGAIWSLYNGNVITGTRYKTYDGVQQFNLNFLLKRDLEPASNDNDPMWLKKAA